MTQRRRDVEHEQADHGEAEELMRFVADAHYGIVLAHSEFHHIEQAVEGDGPAAGGGHDPTTERDDDHHRIEGEVRDMAR